MAQQGIGIGIALIVVVIIVAGGIWYFSNNSPLTNNTEPTPTTFETQNGAVVGALRTDGGEPVMFATVFSMDESQQQSLRSSAQTSSNNASVNAFNRIVQLTLDAAAKQRQMQSIALQIQARASTDYCDDLSLFNQRDQASAEMIALLGEAKQAVSAFITTYPSLATNYNITIDSYDFTVAQAAHEQRVQLTNELESSCGGNN